jgi:hypothetical protein
MALAPKLNYGNEFGEVYAACIIAAKDIVLSKSRRPTVEEMEYIADQAAALFRRFEQQVNKREKPGD